MKTNTMRFAFTSVLSVLLLSSCFKDDHDCQLSPCARKMVEERGWEQYCGQELGCKFYMLSFVVDGCEYFSIDCHCADVLSSTWDCDGVEVVVVPEDCNGLGLDREARIVGVSK